MCNFLKIYILGIWDANATGHSIVLCSEILQPISSSWPVPLWLMANHKNEQKLTKWTIPVTVSSSQPLLLIGRDSHSVAGAAERHACELSACLPLIICRCPSSAYTQQMRRTSVTKEIIHSSQVVFLFTPRRSTRACECICTAGNAAKKCMATSFVFSHLLHQFIKVAPFRAKLVETNAASDKEDCPRDFQAGK